MKTQNLHLSRIKFLGLVGILLIIAVFMTMGAQAQALTWHTANQQTVAWDAVTNRDDGTPIPASDTIEYSVYLANTVTDPNKANPARVWRGPGTTTLITLNTEGSFWVGVRAHRMLADGTEASFSTISWSEDPLATSDGEDWGLRYYLPPADPGGIRRQ